MGSPDFALPILHALAARYTVVGVVSQPDKPAGRGRVLTPPAVKVHAEKLGIPVIQPRRLREPEAMDRLHEWAPEAIVVAAFGQILRPEVLNLPPFGCINVHASLLPRWRGAAPIQAAILNNDRETGVTIMKMDPGIDTGPTLAQRSTLIMETDTAGTLSERLSRMGAELLIETLPLYLEGRLTPQPQNNHEATYAPMLAKENGKIEFTQSAQALALMVRAYNPWPGAYIIWQGQTLKIHKAHAALETGRETGKTYRYEDSPAIGVADGLLVLDEVQPAGKRPMPGNVFLNGARDWAK